MEIKKGGDLICKRPETVIEARYSLTKRQNDVLDMVFATIEDDNKIKYEIDIAKYGQLYNIKDKSNIYRDLKKAVRSFEGKGFEIIQKISEKKQNRIYFNWFSHISYLDGESKIIVGIDPMLKDLMLNAKKACFYQIKYTLNFHNIYSKRLYYYLKSYENSNKNGTGWRIDKLDELRTKLECPKTYDVFYEFKRYVLKPAYEEINGDSDISFEFEEIKTGRKVTALRFYIKSNKARNKALDEVSATREDKYTREEEKLSTGLINEIKAIFKEDITGKEAKYILDTAKGDIHIIKEKYALSQNIAKIDNIVGWIIKAIKEDYKPQKGKIKVGGFNDYEQRAYDFDELEKKLLGWDNKREDEIGEEYQQCRIQQ